MVDITKLFTISATTTMIILMSKFGSNFLLEYLDETIDLPEFAWILVPYFLLLLPMSIDEYYRNYKDCKDKSFAENALHAITSTSKSILATDIMGFVIGFLPFVGMATTVLEFVPYIGSGLVWLLAYFIYRKINDIKDLLYSLLNIFGPLKSVLSPVISIFSKVFGVMFAPMLIIFKPLIMLLNLVWEIVDINDKCEVTSFYKSMLYTGMSVGIAYVNETMPF